MRDHHQIPNAPALPLSIKPSAGGGGVTLCNSMGNPWTADYLKVTGELDVDLRSNIAAEARAKIVYERLINFTDDPGTKDALQFLMTREITHMKVFMSALESMGKDPLDIGLIPPTPGIVDKYFNDSTGENDEGDEDFTGPWNKSNGIEMVPGPAQPIAEATAVEVQNEVQNAVKKSPGTKGKSKKTR